MYHIRAYACIKPTEDDVVQLVAKHPAHQTIMERHVVHTTDHHRKQQMKTPLLARTEIPSHSSYSSRALKLVT